MSDLKWLALFGLLLFIGGMVWLIIIDWKIALAMWLIIWSQGINEDLKRRRQKEIKDAN